MNRLTAGWVRKAEADVAGAKSLALIRLPLNDLACFHCQQAAEKYLKAMLQELGLPVPRTHHLEDLLHLLLPHDAALSALRHGLIYLNRDAVDYRYPGAHANSRQAQAAIRRAEQVRQEICVRLGIRPRRPRRPGPP